MDVEKFSATACAAAVLLMSWSATSIAQMAQQPGQTDISKATAVITPGGTVENKGGLLDTDQLLNKKVVGNNGEKLGEIEHLVIDSTGQVRYGILSRGGFLNMGEKRYAIPWQALQASANNDKYVLNITEDRLANAPSFDRKSRPNFADAKVNQQVYSYYGYQWTPTSGGSVAQQSPRGDFATLDANADGFISKDEAKTAQNLRTNFDRADANADGKLTPSEFSAFEAGQGHDDKMMVP